MFASPSNRSAATPDRHRSRGRSQGTLPLKVIMSCVVAAALTASCSAAEPELELAPTDAMAAASASHSRPTPTPTYAGHRIPDGTWARQISRAEIEKAKDDLPAEFFTSNYFDDGKGRLVLKIRGDFWTIFVEDNHGALEIGDTGVVRYDARGRWLQKPATEPGGLTVAWALTGDTLTLSDPVYADEATSAPEEHFIWAGPWKMQP